MTFNFAPWAIDGARTSAGLARLASYASSGGRSGVIRPGDLKVSALAVPGKGLRITSGGATVLNRYLASPDEAYVVSNPAIHTVLSQVMPSAQPTTSYYLVCVVVGDPEFDQAGHPFMPSNPLDPATAADFEYVRIVVIPCSSSATRTEDLGLNYPAYALARLEVPANTTTITNAMITDLRALAQARSERKLLVDNTTPIQNLATLDAHSNWLMYQPVVKIPEWATRVQIIMSLNGVVTTAAETRGAIRIIVGNGALVGADTVYAVPASADGERTNIIATLDADVRTIAGQSLPVVVQGFRQSAFPNGYITTNWGTQEVLDIQFSETVA